MATLRLVLAALCLSFSALPHAFATKNSSAQLILDTCSAAPFGDLCVKTLTSGVETAETDLKALAQVGLHAAAGSGASTSTFISTQLDKVHKPALQQCLSDCSKNYADAMDQLDDSTAALDNRAYDDVETWVEAAVADAASCRDGCRGLHGPKADDLTRKNTEFSNLCSNALAIVKLLAA